MELAVVGAILTSIVVWAAVSSRMAVISTPIFFVAVGAVLAYAFHPLDLEADPQLTKIIAEVTLVWVLFADASRIKPAELRIDRGRFIRLLALGLPLTMVFGAVAASVLLGVGIWYAVLLGAALSPTDAALGSAVMSDRRVPKRVRQTLNVESGLNDGIATPVVTAALAAIAAEVGIADGGTSSRALLGLLLGTAIGLVLGAGGAMLLRFARGHGWRSEELTGPAILALSLLCFVAATSLGANGFVAAFVGGIGFGASVGRGREKEVYYVEQTCGLASMVAWLLFGALATPTLIENLSWQVVVYAVLSLTLIRMLPVALCLLGSGTDAVTTAFIGWFGPRGLASVVFALLAIEELHDVPGPMRVVVCTIGCTVWLSVLAHGVSARPLAGRYGSRMSDQHIVDHPEPNVRRLVSSPKRNQG